MNEAVRELEGKLSELRAQEGGLGQILSKWETEIEKIGQQQSYEQRDLDRVTAGRDKIRELREQLAGSEDIQDDSRQALGEMSQQRDRLSETIRKTIAEKESLSEQIHALDKECVRLRSRRERLQEDVDNRVAYMWEEYEITLSDAKALRDENLKDISALKKEIAECKSRIKALGSVNVDAVEEYRELMERYTFLKGQHDDLTEAADALTRIIGELDASMKKQFEEQFGRIRAEFDKVFKTMFGGGTGRLELMEDKDILEAGVRVIAQPPGKKLQNMNALSGGEKALTAIALLFAIQNLKPSPFCLLDEIEAALDESNVVRFADYLHKLTEYTQFIVITHRRGTMQEADRLYGITMQEKGVSALVSVDLIDEEELT